MGNLEDSNATNNNDASLIVIADDTTPTNRATVNASGRLLTETEISGSIVVLLGRSQIYDIMNSSGWMRGAIFDNVTISVAGTVATLSFYEDSALLGNSYVDFTDNDNWELILDRYLDEDDGTPLLLDNDDEINMD